MKNNNERFWVKPVPKGVGLLPNAKFLSKKEADELLNRAIVKSDAKATVTKGKKKQAPAKKSNGTGWTKPLPTSYKLVSSMRRLSKKEADELSGPAPIKPKSKVLTAKGKK